MNYTDRRDQIPTDCSFTQYGEKAAVIAGEIERLAEAVVVSVENVINPKIVQEQLGYASIEMTLDISSHLLPDTQDVAVQDVAALLVG